MWVETSKFGLPTSQTSTPSPHSQHSTSMPPPTPLNNFPIASPFCHWQNACPSHSWNSTSQLLLPQLGSRDHERGGVRVSYIGDWAAHSFVFLRVNLALPDSCPVITWLNVPTDDNACLYWMEWIRPNKIVRCIRSLIATHRSPWPLARVTSAGNRCRRRATHDYTWPISTMASCTLLYPDTSLTATYLLHTFLLIRSLIATHRSPWPLARVTSAGNRCRRRATHDYTWPISTMASCTLLYPDTSLTATYLLNTFLLTRLAQATPCS
ncbi:hypothetical protein BC629DRAFT_1168465 [Irpex lacteus]|nr:hypothetical protein BC629DRAFT_1168465 [Irpex lacteus]